MLKSGRGILLAKYGSYLALLLFFYVLQTTPGLFELWGVKPVLVMAAAVAIAMFEGELVGGIYGAFAGLLCDTSGFTLFGYQGLLLCFVCVVIGLLVDYLMQPTLFTYMAYLLGALVLIYGLNFLFSYGIWRLPSLERLFFKKVVLVSLYTTLVSPLFYYLFRGLSRRFQRQSSLFARTIL